MTNKPLSIYVHVPFCLSKCKYCSFYSEIYEKECVLRYFEALKKTATFFSGLPENENAVVETVYFGGGTPTTVDANVLCDFLIHLKKCFNFTKECEITIEANPKTVTSASAKLLRESGFNRVSIGIQTTDDSRLSVLGRIHTFEDAKEAFSILKSAGFENISVDLMYALPDSKLENVLFDLENILKLSPKHISTYALSLEEGTPLYTNKESFIFPDDDEQMEEYLLICNKLRENGFHHYEISNFAMDGFESKHNLGYWQRREYIGFGAGAHSFWSNKRFSSKADRRFFVEACEKSDYISALGLNEAEEISDFDKREEEIMLSLRISKGLPLPSLSSRIQKLVDEGLANYSNGVFSLTDKGFFVSNSIIYYLCKELLYDKK